MRTSGKGTPALVKPNPASFRIRHPRELGNTVREVSKLRLALPKLKTALLNSLLKLIVQPLQLPGLPVKLGKYRDLSAQKLRDYRNGDVIDRSALVSANAINIGQVDGGDKD